MVRELCKMLHSVGKASFENTKTCNISMGQPSLMNAAFVGPHIPYILMVMLHMHNAQLYE